VNIPDDKTNYILQNPVGKVFYLENLNDTGAGRVEYKPGKEANQSVPGVPIVKDLTENSVTIDGGAGTQVRIGTGKWSNSPHTFEGLEENKVYTAYSRYSATETHYASGISEGVEFEPVSIVIPSEPFNFAYTGGAQEFVVPADGKYKLEVWGAQGGGTLGGNGGYSKGELHLNKDEIINIYVGGQGDYHNKNGSYRVAGGWNGGGTGGDADAGGGGGASATFV
jgi:hypothetical protein